MWVHASKSGWQCVRKCMHTPQRPLGRLMAVVVLTMETVNGGGANDGGGIAVNAGACDGDVNSGAV